MKRKKAAAALLGGLSVCSLAGGIISYAAGNDVLTKDISMSNGFLCLCVEQNSEQGEYLKYRLDTTGGQEGNEEDNDINITYRNFYSGYTTINIDGINYIYGQGTDVLVPSYDVENKCHVSAQKFGDVVIQQNLTFAEGYTKGYDDMLRISYKVIESHSENSIGVRVLIDTMIGDDDALNLYVNDAKLENEAAFNNSIPKSWRAESKKNSKAASYGKTDDNSILPSSVTFADWYNIYDDLWNYMPDISSSISDASVAVTWDPVSDAEDKEFATLYGIKNGADTGTNKSATLSSPKTGSSVPVCAIILLIISAILTATSVILGRKEKENVES